MQKKDSKYYWGKRREECKEKKLCYRCKNNAPHINCNACLECLMKKASIRNTGTSENWEILLEKLKIQEYKCFYTGEILIIGENASLDHMLPRVKFPELWDDLDNIVWCTTEINRSKGDLTYAEFLGMCNAIIDKDIKRYSAIEECCVFLPIRLN